MNNHDIITPEEKKLQKRLKKKDAKARPKMKVSGKSVQKIQKLIHEKGIDKK